MEVRPLQPFFENFVFYFSTGWSFIAHNDQLNGIIVSSLHAYQCSLGLAQQ